MKNATTGTTSNSTETLMTDTTAKNRRHKPGLHKRVVKGVKKPRPSRSKYAEELKAVKPTKPGSAPEPRFTILVPPSMMPLMDRLHSARGIVERSDWLSDEAKAVLLLAIREQRMDRPEWGPDGIVAYQHLRPGFRYMTDAEHTEARKAVWRPGDDGHMPHR